MVKLFFINISTCYLKLLKYRKQKVMDEKKKSEEISIVLTE